MSQAAAALTLYDAVSQLDRHFGGGFVYAPRRWGTHDGTIPYRAVYPAMDAMRRQLAGERLHLISAERLAHGGEAAAAAIRAQERVANGAA